MTKEEILAMEMGEELDILVALEVMQESAPRLIPENALDLQLAGSPIKSPKGNWLCVCRYDESDIPTWRPLLYSTDISAAWLVKEEMKGKGLLMKLIELCPTGRMNYRVEFWDNSGLEPSRRLGAAEGEDAPEAICKAALIANLEK